jgi:hypothetical protein
MDATLLSTLITRKDELLKELNHIEGLIKIYQGAEPSDQAYHHTEVKMVRTRFGKRRTNVKSQIISLIKSLGDEFYVLDLTKALQEKEPNKDHKLISNKARNYIHILKKEGVISGKLVDKNKYVYKLINK